jgi:hypothetical protein
VNLAAIVLFSWIAASPQNASLDQLRTTILSLREHPNENQETRGATAQLTRAKQQLRDWVESYLPQFGETDDPLTMSEEIRNRISEADLFCIDYNIQCFPSSIGFVDDVRFDRLENYLVIRTAVGIWCGYDYSAYLYKREDNRWRRIWVNEQDDYTPGKYLPQVLHSVQISAPDKDGNRLLLTLGSKPGCSSAFMPIYARAWQMNSRNEVGKLVLDHEEVVSLDSDPPVLGRVTPSDVLLQFTAGGTGYGDAHIAVRHFQIRNDRAEQTDLVAMTPRDFVEEWLNAQWIRSSTLSESPSLKQWHDKLHREDGQGDFPDKAMRCTTPDLWQVGANFPEAPKYYYRVRWREPYRFTMVEISENPFPDCSTPDPKGDQHPDLFGEGAPLPF